MNPRDIFENNGKPKLGVFGLIWIHRYMRECTKNVETSV